MTRNHIARINADGTLDTSFNPNANDWVYMVAVQADGKILIIGSFNMVGGQPRIGFARLKSDGTLDDAFNPNANNGGGGEELAVQADGKILVAGWFTTIDGQTRNRIARLNADGTLDASFDPNANGQVVALAIQADGKILAGGSFDTIGGQTRNHIARFNAPPLPPASRPTLKVIGRKRIITSKRRYKVKGSAADADGDLIRIDYRLLNKWNIGRPFPAKSFSRWGVSFPLKSGRNVIKFRSVDAAGNNSKTVRVTIIRRSRRR